MPNNSEQREEPTPLETKETLKRVHEEAHGFEKGIPSLETVGIQTLTTDMSREELAERTIAAAMKEPEVMKKVAEKLTEATRKIPRAKTERPGENQLQRIIAELERSGTLTRRRGKRVIEVRGKRVAEDIRNLLRIFESEAFNAKTPAERERTIRESMELLTTDERLKNDLREAFEARGWLTKKEGTEARRIEPPGAEQTPDRRFVDAQKKATDLFTAFEQKLKQVPTFETFVPFLIESDGIAQLQKYFEQMAEAAKGMPNPSISVAALETIASDVKRWGENQLSALQGGTLADNPDVLKNLAAGLGTVFYAFPAASPVPTPELEPHPPARPPAPTSPEPAPTPAAGGVPAVPPPPPKKPEDFTTLAGAGMEGTGWKEAPRAAPVAERAPGITPPSVRSASALEQAGQTLLERGGEGEPTLDNPLFQRFLLSVEDATGRKPDLRNAAEMGVLATAFAKRAEVAAGFVGLFDGEVKKVLGAEFSAPELVRSVSAYIESLSQTNPKNIEQYHALFTEAAENQREGEALETRRSRLVSGEEERAAAAALTEKQRVLALAKESTRFLTGLGRLTGLAAKVFGSEKLKAQAQARKAAHEMGYGTGWLGAVGTGLGMFGGIKKELATIGVSIEEIKSEKSSELHEVSAKLLDAQNRLTVLKKELLSESAMRNEAAEIARSGAQAAFEGWLRAPEAPRMEELKRFDRAEETLEHLLAASAGATEADIFDTLRRMGSPDALRKKIHEGAEALARRIIARKLSETLAEPRSPGRHSTLQRELSELFSREKLGSRKGTGHVRQFVREELQRYLSDLETAKVSTTGTELELLRLRAAAVEGVLAGNHTFAPQSAQ